MRVLVTGATGFLGSNITRGLVAAGHRVRVLARPQSPLDLLTALPIEIVRGDVRAPASLAPAVDGMEAVIHCAAQMRGGRNLAERIRSHLDGTRKMLAAARDARLARFVHVSSVAALGIPDAPPAASDAGAIALDETHTWNAPAEMWPYGFAKHQAEEEVRSAAASGLEAVIVNPSIVFGAGDRNRVSNALLLHAARGRLPPILPGGVGVVHVEDVVDGTLAALEKGRSGERYILNSENLTVERLLQMAAEVAGVEPPRVRLSLRTARRLAWMANVLAFRFRIGTRPVLLDLAGRYFYYDSRKARRELGVSLARPARLGAQQALAWYADPTPLRARNERPESGV
ncbi:MAG TPA: NAD-dependent epimerase/dehydratase family protein [Anaerolineales bacterium]|nr:NAD-dependent epimerase/dehydratase family protein [Anaerolineales bacterium]